MVVAVVEVRRERPERDSGDSVDDIQEVNVEQVMEQIREDIRRRRQGSSPADGGSPASHNPVAADLASLHNTYDLSRVYFTSHRRVLGRFVIFAKQGLRKLLSPILQRQLAYNAANTRVASYLWEQVEGIRQQQAAALPALREITLGQIDSLEQQQVTALQALQVEVAEQVEGIRRQQAAVQEEIAGLGQQQATALHALRETVTKQMEGIGQEQATALQALFDTAVDQIQGLGHRLEKTVTQLKRDLMLQERRITLLLEEARRRLPNPLSQEQVQVMIAEANHSLNALYVAFEDQFRGTREDIKDRLRVYLPIVKEAKLGTDAMQILDVGCGRGEWLELLKEEDLQAYGLDLNRVLVAECHQRGLSVVEGDVLSYLRSLPDASLGAVTGFHLIEHLPFEAFVKLLDETVRVLRPGGLAVFETPNPQNVLVSSYSFYLDPTHRHPLPSSTVKFIAEARGLCRVEIMPLHPFPATERVQEADLDVAQRFNEYFYGPQDYAVLGWKA